MTADTQQHDTDKAPEREPCGFCEGNGYTGNFIYCGHCWGTGNGALDKGTADRRALDIRWAKRMHRLAQQQANE